MSHDVTLPEIYPRGRGMSSRFPAADFQRSPMKHPRHRAPPRTCALAATPRDGCDFGPHRSDTNGGHEEPRKQEKHRHDDFVNSKHFPLASVT